MGILADSRSRRVLTLPAHCLVGRSAACFVRIASTHVSSEHARLSWTGEHWELRDLGSRNGTTVDGRPVKPGAAVPLVAGATLCFGEERACWTLLEDSGPVPAMRDPVTGRVRVAREGLLVLSESGSELPYLHELAGGQWLLEGTDGPSMVRDGDVVTVDGQAWVLHLAEPVPGTEESSGRSLWLGSLDFSFAVSPDEEYVTLSLRAGETEHALPPRAHHYLLLTLARMRRQDGDGWCYGDELARRLGIEETSLNVQIFRARDELVRLGVADASGVVERRRGTGQIRTGILRFSERQS